MDGSSRDLYEVSGRGVDLFLAECAFEQVEAFFLAVGNVQRWAAAGRNDSFHDEVSTVALGAGDEESVPVPSRPVAGPISTG